MSAQMKFLLAIFYLCALLALFAPVALAYGNETQTNTTQGPSNTTNPQTPTNTDDDESAGAIQLSSTVALFGALVAAAVFTL